MSAHANRPTKVNKWMAALLSKMNSPTMGTADKIHETRLNISPFMCWIIEKVEYDLGNVPTNQHRRLNYFGSSSSAEWCRARAFDLFRSREINPENLAENNVYCARSYEGASSESSRKGKCTNLSLKKVFLSFDVWYWIVQDWWFSKI